ncbi:hypothetical protein M7I_6752 [Glarea lozoyensis 74030]|uniref:Uncharacterized protein n=1 Tax=Glarea lozoyensis (strain ATCC 74030 / MF5533) TaxID=1104152 RepID=H0EVF4_GLAL7|nr:hypothetical protein M7I_6752 [Glarea lozoyensis 74030]
MSTSFDSLRNHTTGFNTTISPNARSTFGVVVLTSSVDEELGVKPCCFKRSTARGSHVA